MADKYVKAEVKVTVSTSPDHSDPKWIYEAEDPITEEVESTSRHDEMEIGTSSESIENVGRYSAVNLFYVRNRDATNYVTITYKAASLAGTITDRIPAGRAIMLANLDPAQDVTLQANGAAVLVDIIIIGET